jgi:hypothetical protein
MASKGILSSQNIKNNQGTDLYISNGEAIYVSYDISRLISGTKVKFLFTEEARILILRNNEVVCFSYSLVLQPNARTKGQITAISLPCVFHKTTSKPLY